MYKKGTLLVDKHGVTQYEKMGDNEWDWWVSHTSTYVVITKETVEEFVPTQPVIVDETLPLVDEAELPVTTKGFKKKKTTVNVYTVRPESEKPLYNEEGKLNRSGFKWTDQQVFEYYVTGMKWTVVEK